MATGFYIQGLGIVGSLVFVVSGAVVIDGNGDGIWWQVLAVAFCIGQQLVVGVGATVRKLTMLRLCDTPLPLGLLTPVSRRLLPDDTKQQTGMRPPPNMMQYTRSGSSLVEQSMRDASALVARQAESLPIGILQLGPSCRFIHPFSANNLSIESAAAAARPVKRFCAQHTLLRLGRHH